MNLFSHHALSPDGTLPLGSLAGKHPIIVGTVARHFLPLLQHLGEQRSHRDRLGRGFSLAPADNTVNNRTHDVDFCVVEVQVAPSQPEEFTLAQTSRGIEKDEETRKECDVV